MGERKPRTDRLLIASAKLQADLTELVTEVAYDFSPGQVAELAITAQDPTGRLDNSPLAELGTTVTATDTRDEWTVGSVEASYGAGITWTYRCRSSLAKRLRATFKVGAETQVSPTDWVTRRVKDAGGKVVAQKSAKRVAIGQGGNSNRQSSLDIINSLAGELEWAWVEHGSTLYFGDPYWALKGGPGLPTWPVTWKQDPASDAQLLSVSLSDDDTESRGTLDLTLPHKFGRRLRPWHRLELKNVGRYSGTWLVDTVSWTDDDVSTVDVSCSLPRKPSKKDGST